MERAEASDNAFLRQSPRGPTYTSASTVFLNTGVRTPTTTYTLNSDFTYTKYLGPGARDTTGSEAKNEGASFNIDHRMKTTTSNFGVTWRRTDVATAQLLDTGRITARGTSDVYAANWVVRHQLNAADTVTWSVGESWSTFSAPNSTPFRDVRSSVTLNHAATRTTQFVALVSFDKQMFDNATKSETTLWRATGGIHSSLTPRLDVRANLGFIKTDTGSNGSGAPTVFNPLQTSSSGSGIGLIWDTLLAYRIDPTTRITFITAQSVSPSLLGELTKRRVYGLTLTRAINRSSDLSFSGDFSTITSSSGDSEFLTATAVYSRVLAREWRMQLGYGFRQLTSGNAATTGSGTAAVRSNTVFLTATRDATLLP